MISVRSRLTSTLLSRPLGVVGFHPASPKTAASTKTDTDHVGHLLVHRIGSTGVSHAVPAIYITTRSFRTHQAPAFRRYKKKESEITYAHTVPLPNMDMAQSMPISYTEMDNNSLITIAAMENHEARCEVLKRHIMSVDDVDYGTATKTFTVIAAANRKYMRLAALPYQIGFMSALTAAFVSIPLVFDLTTAEWFNHHYVTTDVPEPADLETIMEVGAWTWNWMEPPLGQISFFLLCLQFSRSQMENLGVRPFTRKLKEMRARRLIREFDRYDEGVIEAFSETDPIVIDNNPSFLGPVNPGRTAMRYQRENYRNMSAKVKKNQ